jgi:hypothetical protein
VKCDNERTPEVVSERESRRYVDAEMRVHDIRWAAG